MNLNKFIVFSRAPRNCGRALLLQEHKCNTFFSYQTQMVTYERGSCEHCHQKCITFLSNSVVQIDAHLISQNNYFVKAILVSIFEKGKEILDFGIIRGSLTLFPQVLSRDIFLRIELITFLSNSWALRKDWNSFQFSIFYIEEPSSLKLTFSNGTGGYA